MNDTEMPLDLDAIEKRLENAWSKNGGLAYPVQDFINHAPTDIAALVAEVKRLREHLRILEDTLAPYLDDGED